MLQLLTLNKNSKSLYNTVKLDFTFNIKFLTPLNSILFKNNLWRFTVFKSIQGDVYIKLLGIYIKYYSTVLSEPHIAKFFNVILPLFSPKPLYLKNYVNFIEKKKELCKKSFNFFFYNIKWLLIALLIAVMYFFVSIVYIQLDFTKQLAIWYILFIIYYLLMSTFNSFLTKYRYGKFTSAIQRFWKRTGTIFWLIEGFLFLLFFYYFLNSSQEPLYMFDYANLNQEYLIQLKTTYKNMVLLSIAIYLGFILILNINYLIFYQNVLLLTVISLIIFYTLYLETYQFVYIINIFADKDWNFDEEDQTWSLEIEENNLRVKQQYFVLCLIAKYWHFIFIFISWFFFYIKSLESNSVSITMLGYNIQNILILYILNFMCLIQWVKFVLKKFLEVTYYWFFIQYDEKFYLTAIVEIWNTVISFCYFESYQTVFVNCIKISNVLIGPSEFSVWKLK